VEQGLAAVLLPVRINSFDESLSTSLYYALTNTASCRADARDGRAVPAIRLVGMVVRLGLQNTFRCHTPTTALRIIGGIDAFEAAHSSVVDAFLVSPHAC